MSTIIYEWGKDFNDLNRTYLPINQCWCIFCSIFIIQIENIMKLERPNIRLIIASAISKSGVVKVKIELPTPPPPKKSFINNAPSEI